MLEILNSMIMYIEHNKHNRAIYCNAQVILHNVGEVIDYANYVKCIAEGSFFGTWALYLISN